VLNEGVGLRSKGSEIRELRPFLYRTLRHLIIDEYRRKKSVSLEQWSTVPTTSAVSKTCCPDDSNTLEAAVERFDGKRALAALEELPTPIAKRCHCATSRA